MNYLKCPKSKSLSHCLTELFSIYQNKHWTIRRRDGHIVVPSSNRIKLKIDGFLIFTKAGRKPNGLDLKLFEKYLTSANSSIYNTYDLFGFFKLSVFQTLLDSKSLRRVFLPTAVPTLDFAAL